MRGKQWFQSGRLGIYSRRLFAVVMLFMFVFGLVGWLDGWGDNVTQEVTQVVQKEADVFSSPAMVQGTVEYLAHKWFDFTMGIENWKDTSVKSSMQSNITGDTTSRVITVAVDTIKKTGDNTAEITAWMMREVAEKKEGEEKPQTNYRTDQLIVSLVYKNGKMEPLSGPVVAKGEREYGIDFSYEYITLPPDKEQLIQSLAKGYVSAVSSDREQISFLFKDPESAPNPVSGKLKLQQVIPIKMSGSEVTVLLRVQQIDETGVVLNQVHYFVAEQVQDRYLITKLMVGDHS